MDALTYAALRHGLAIAGLFLLMSVSLAWSVRTDDNWRRDLNNLKISITGDQSIESNIYLCPDGFLEIYDAETSVAGRWDVSDGRLVMTISDGEMNSYELYKGMDPNILVLNGESLRVEKHNGCR